MGLDVKFIQSKHVFGLPEHATAFKLQSTDGNAGNGFSDPYRLFNLDVFEYDPHNPRGLYGSVPFLLALSSDGEISSGFFWKNPSDTFVDIQYLGNNTAVHWMSESASLEFSVFLGNEPSDIIKGYISISGNPALPPLFAIGYHQCRWNYDSQEDIKYVNSKFEEYDIPMDVLWLDIEHTNKKKYFTWGDNFPEPKVMQKELALSCRKLVTIIDPHIKVDPSYSIYQDCLEKDFFVKKADGQVFTGDCWPGKSAWIDYLDPEARLYWASRFSYKNYEGSTKNLFVWNDMNEVYIFSSR